MQNFKYYYLFSIAYDGSSFHGWIIQNNKRTVQQTFEQALKILIKKAEFRIIGASKTDAGVHALDQKVLLMVNFEIKNLATFVKGLNCCLPYDVHVNNGYAIDKNFLVRDVKQKTYCYTINDQNYNIFQTRYELQYLKQKIDCERLQEIFNLFVGEHDFFLFSGLSYQEKEHFQTKRTIDMIKVQRNSENKIEIIFQAKGFVRYQIRMIVGGALNCYEHPGQSKTIISQLDGKGEKSRYNAIPNGLCLLEIKY